MKIKKTSRNLNGNVSFMYKGKFLPSHKTFRELGIDPEKERITIMATHVGEPK